MKIVLLIRTDGTFTVDTPFKLDNILFFLKDTHILETSGVLFLQKYLSQRKKVCSGIQVFSRELFKIMFYLMKFHLAFFLLFSIPRVKSKSKNTPYLRQTTCVSAQCACLRGNRDKTGLESSAVFPQPTIATSSQSSSGPVLVTRRGGGEGVVKFLRLHTSGNP